STVKKCETSISVSQWVRICFCSNIRTLFLLSDFVLTHHRRSPSRALSYNRSPLTGGRVPSKLRCLFYMFRWPFRGCRNVHRHWPERRKRYLRHVLSRCTALARG